MKTMFLCLLATLTLAACSVQPDGDHYQLTDRTDLPRPTIEADADHCEFYVNSLGTERYHYGGGGYDELLVVAYLSVDVGSLVQAQGGKILQVGMRMNGQDDVAVQSEIERGYYKLRQTLWETGYNRSQYDLHYFAFFIDVQRPGGEVARLWLKNGDWDFNWPDVFQNYPKHVINRGPNSLEYVKDPSPIYNQKKSCI